MLQIRRILQLKLLGKSNRDIARELHRSRTTVNEYMKRITESGREIRQLLDLNDQELSSLLQACCQPVPADSRLADLMNRLPSLTQELQKPHATRMVIWQEYSQKVDDGYSYPQFCEHLNRYLAPRRAVMHLEHEPGASMMFDFAGDKLPLVDPHTGEITRHPVLVCVLPFSAFTYVEVLQSAGRELLLKALNNALSYYGGVPLSAKTDNMKQVVKKANRYEPSFDELFEQWSLHYSCALMASRVRKPRDKASVESHVNVVYNRIYAPLRNKVLHTIDQANEALWEQMDKLNATNFQRCDYSRRDKFTLHEKPHLQPLPSGHFIPKTKVNAKVQRNYCVTLGQDWHHYSVPCQNIGKTVQIVYDAHDVEIYAGMVRIAYHRRDYHKYGHTILKEHMPPNHRFYARIKGWSPEYFIEKASLIGPNTRQVMSRILEQRRFVEQTYNSCLGLLRLDEKYEKPRLENACKRALKGYKVTYGNVRDILKNGLDKAEDDDDLFSSLPDHDNIRGPESYK